MRVQALAAVAQHWLAGEDELIPPMQRGLRLLGVPQLNEAAELLLDAPSFIPHEILKCAMHAALRRRKCLVATSRILPR